MAEKRRRKSIPILNGRASLAPPTEAKPYYQILYQDPITGKAKRTTGGKNQEEATRKAAAILGDYIPEHSVRGLKPPTLEMVFEDWVNSKRATWSTRTVDNYEYLSLRFLNQFGQTPIMADRLSWYG